MPSDLPSKGEAQGSPPPRVPAVPPGDAAVQFAERSEPGMDRRRYVSAVMRYKWLILLVTVVGTAAGVGAARFFRPDYLAQATIWINSPTPGGARGPIQPGQLLASYSWVELLKSFVVLDEVVRELRLYLQPRSPDDTLTLASFGLKEQFSPGDYVLTTDDRGQSFTLSTRAGLELQTGAVGDSIGQDLGFTWVPSTGSLAPGQRVEFSVIIPRDAAQRLSNALEVRLDANGNFMRILLRGTDPWRIAATVNAVTQRYVGVASDLKRAKLTEVTRILVQQLQYAERNLRESEILLQRFRVETATLPSERATPVVPGLLMTQDPVFARFFETRIEREALRRDREAVLRVLSKASDAGISVDALDVIESVQKSSEMTAVLSELADKQAEFRALRSRYTDEYAPLQQLRNEIELMQQQTIPRAARDLVGEIQAREAELNARVTSGSEDLRQIPPRAIEEARLSRDVAIAENLFANIQQRYEEARLAEASSMPDVRILDGAVVPRQPVKNRGPQVVLMALVGSFGAAILGAVLLDRVDPRLRYPEQVTRDLGLTILGAVPHVKHYHRKMQDNRKLHGEDTVQIVEALRGIRLNLAYAHGVAGTLAVTVSSPGPADGKSFVSSNLALAFADIGYRTLLMDADVRRGRLHATLGATRKPGLIDFLDNKATQEEIVQATNNPELYFIGGGTRRDDGPELLSSGAMSELVTSLRSSYRVILIDSPPLGGGADPCVLGTLTGNLLLVLRTGVSDRGFMEAKLDVLDRLPIRVLGAVLNDVRATGADRYYAFSYYTYLPGYGVEGDHRA